MDGKILVCYASKYGATKEIAEKIGEVLVRAGIQVDVVPVDRARDLNPYQAVILGSAVYMGQWQKKAVKLLQDKEKSLAGRKVWLFSSGPTGTGDPVELLKGWRLPEAVKPIADRIQPRDIAVFHGFVDPDKLNFIEKQAIKTVNAPTGDFRDWGAITNWAAGIAAAVTDVTHSP